jgi:muramoyltetrapeptide carboxypeptidase
VDEDEVQRGIDALDMAGIQVVVSPHALDRDDYLAGNDADRAADLLAAFGDDSTDGVICTRGGYGTLRLLSMLDFSQLRGHFKPFIGFSDITALQIALYQRLGWITYSGPQLTRGFGGDLHPFSHDHFFTMVGGESWGKPMPYPEESSPRSVRDGLTEGTLFGGNLAVLASLCGTGFQPSFEGCIAVLEEIDEPPYRIDRTLTQLLLAGVFEGVRGIVLGSFAQHVQGERHERSETAERVLSEAISDVPIIAGVPYGHVGPCWTLPLGSPASLDAKAGELTLERGE